MIDYPAIAQRDTLRADLSRLIAEYEAAHGQVQTMPLVIRGKKPALFNNTDTQANVRSRKRGAARSRRLTDDERAKMQAMAESLK
jgi:hypothetical protein